MTSPNPPQPQPVPGEPYQTAPLTAAAIEQGAAAYQSLVVAPWINAIRTAVFPPVGPTDPFGVLSGAAYWLRGVRNFLREHVRPYLAAPWEALFGTFFDQTDPWQRNYALTVQNLLVNTPDMVYASIRDLIDRESSQGTPLPRIAEQIDQMFLDSGSPWWRNRAIVVAKTETRRAQMGGLFHAYDDFGRQHSLIYVKQWLDSADSRVREAHVDTDGQRRPIGAPFAVGVRGGASYPAMFPLDPQLPPELSIQCRCDMLIEEAGLDRTLMTNRRFVGLT
jgi:hypothetical protein